MWTGSGIPNITINNIIIIIPAIITGIRNRRIASVTIAIRAIISSVRIEPLYEIMLANPVSDCDIEKRIIVDIKSLRNSFSES